MYVCRLSQLAANGEEPLEVNPAGPTASVEVTSALCTAYLAESHVQTWFSSATVCVLMIISQN